MCNKKIFGGSSTGKSDSSAKLQAQQNAATEAAAEAERKRLAEMRGRATLSQIENQGDPDRIGNGWTLR